MIWNILNGETFLDFEMQEKIYSPSKKPEQTYTLNAINSLEESAFNINQYSGDVQ
jgi:hypothetical protein